MLFSRRLRTTQLIVHHSCAAADGLFLHPIGQRDAEIKSLCIGYGNNSIASASRDDDNELRAQSIEAHGVVGTGSTNLASQTDWLTAMI